MKYSNEVYLGAIAALAELRPSLADKEQYTVDFIAECIAEKADRDINGGWISVEDQLPCEDGFYITVIKGEICGQSEPFVGSCGYYDGKFDEGDMITHWQPFPELPEEGVARK